MKIPCDSRAVHIVDALVTDVHGWRPQRLFCVVRARGMVDELEDGTFTAIAHREADVQFGDRITGVWPYLLVVRREGDAFGSPLRLLATQSIRANPPREYVE